MKQDFKCSLHKYASNTSTLFPAATVSQSFHEIQAMRISSGRKSLQKMEYKLWSLPETMGSNVPISRYHLGVANPSQYQWPPGLFLHVYTRRFWPSYLRVNLQNHWGQRRDVEKDIRQRGVLFFHPAPFRSGKIGHFPFLDWRYIIEVGETRMIFSELVELQMDTSPWVSSQDWIMDMSHNSIRRLPGPTCPTPPVPNTPVDLPWTRLASATPVKNDISLTRVASGESVGLLVYWGQILPKWCCD